MAAKCPMCGRAEPCNNSKCDKAIDKLVKDIKKKGGRK